MSLFLPLAAFSLLWIDLIRQLSYTWSSNEQYAYGWFVPILALGLLLKKWPDRPAPYPISTFSSAPHSLLPALCAFLFALLLFPLRVIHEINQDWPLISWPLTGAVVVITLYAVFLMGGWRWVRYFGFPICFILVAVRWPYRIEHTLTQNLMQVAANLTVEGLGWLNVPALQRGNIIEISNGVVGIDEACSGIRSFQTTLMAALFLGELYLLRWPIWLLLVAVGLAAAFLLNVCRTIILSWLASKNGLATIHTWHDPAGFTIALSCFVLLWLIAVIVKRKWALDSSHPEVCPHTFQRSALSFQPIFRYFLAIGCWTIFVIGFNEVWYRSHELRQADTAQWWTSYPTNLPSFRTVDVSKTAQKLLRHDTESCGVWEEPDGTKWSVYCFRWKAANPTARMSALGHRPEYCMVGSGHNLTATFGTRYLPANGLELPFRLYTFDSLERPLHVFFCLWEDGAETQPGIGRNKYLDRLNGVMSGRRGMGQQTLEIICSGYSSMEEASKAVQRRLPELVRIGVRG